MPAQAGDDMPDFCEDRPDGELPTLQRHALCKLFDRPDFTAADVAELGYRRLQRVSGIGPKGLEIICTWVRAQGHLLQPGAPSRGEREEQRVQRAIRLLQRLGYEIQHPQRG